MENTKTYISDILEKLKSFESLIKNLETKKYDLDLVPVRNLIEEGQISTPNCISRVGLIPLTFTSEDTMYQAVLSVLKTEALKLKAQLKEELGIESFDPRYIEDYK